MKTIVPHDQRPPMSVEIAARFPMELRQVKDRYHMTGGAHGGHSLRITSTTNERLAAHWKGYLHNTNPLSQATPIEYLDGK